jgi:DNA-binding CsgD family transcriptional regulator
MQTVEIADFFKNLLRTWESGCSDRLKTYYHDDFVGQYHDDKIHLEQLLQRAQYAGKRYTNIDCRMIDVIKIDNCRYHLLSSFYAIDTDTTKEVEMTVSSVLQLHNKKIINAWTLTSKKVNITLSSDQNEDLSIGCLQRKKMKELINKIAIERKKEINISNREMDCLYLYLGALTAKQIGAALNISYRTVEAHIKNIKNKYNLNKQVLVSMMLRLI